MLTLLPWLRWGVLGFSAVLCIMSSKFSLYSAGWGGGSSTRREIKLHLTWRGEQTLFGILLYGMSSAFVYLLNHLFILVWTLVYLGCNPIPHYLFYYSKFSSVGHWELLQLAPVSLQHVLIHLFIVLVLPYFLALKDAPVLESAISLRSSSPFIGEWDLETKL